MSCFDEIFEAFFPPSYEEIRRRQESDEIARRLQKAINDLKENRQQPLTKSL